MKHRPKLLSTKRKVRFQDCDPFNHLNNSKYIDYFINAREDQLLEFYDIDIFKVVKEKGIAWVIAAHQIAYLSAAKAMEEVVIDSQLISFSEKSLNIEMRMYDECKSNLKSVIWTSYVLVNLKTQRPVRHDQRFMNLFKEVWSPITEKDFQSRLHKIKKAA